MDKIIQNWQERLDEVTKEVMSCCKDLQSHELNWKANAQTWSIAQVLEHLIKVNESYYPALASVQQGTYRLPWTARVRFLPRLFGRMILKSVKPENARKVRTFPIWEPVQNTVDNEVLNAFMQHQTKLKTAITSSIDLLKKGAIISSPANVNIVYTMEDAFQIVVTHEERHLGQLKRILSLMKSQARVG